VLFSVEWLCRIAGVAADAARLAEALTARGLTVDSIDERGGGAVLEVDVPANRPDCLGHRGLAREIAAALGGRLAPLAAGPAAAGGGERVRVTVEDPRLCPRYTAGVASGVRVGPAPGWVVQRLEACGLRSVNNVVDASNLVMLELGQPVHFFDRARLGGGGAEIVVRRARSGESLTTLDGVARRLDPDVLVIADARHAIALAGIMGGAETEIGPDTREVLVEAARFDPRSVRGAARRLGLQTDASFRFERGVDAAGIPAAQRLALRLLEELAGARSAGEFVDVDPVPTAPRVLSLRHSSLERLLGYAVEPAAAAAALHALELDPAEPQGDRLHVRIPSWRADLEREADLVEEVARHLGYERIPARVPEIAAGGASAAESAVEDRARDLMAWRGFHEAIGYAMLGAGEDAPFVRDGAPAAVAISNPIAEPLSHLRRSLLPGLLRALELNLRRGTRDVRLFEVARVFLASGAGGPIAEPSRLGLAWCGAASPAHWSAPTREVDLFDLLGTVEGVLEGLAPCAGIARQPASAPACDPRASVVWCGAAGPPLAWGGALHPERQEALGAPVFVAEFDLAAIAGIARPAPPFRDVPRLPAVTRDLSLVLAPRTTFAELLRALGAVPAPAAVEFSAIDRYSGPPLEPGEVSVTLRFRLQPLERTLTTPETESYRAALVARLEADLGVRLRA